VTSAYQLDGDLLAVLIVGAKRTIDFPHAASADSFRDFVGSNATADHRIGLGIAGRGLIQHRLSRASIQKIRARILMRRDE
jgi:hypothetical protein